MVSIGENGIPFATVIGAHIKSGILSQVWDAKDFGETLCCLANSRRFTRDLHDCFYTTACAFVQAVLFKQARRALPAIPETLVVGCFNLCARMGTPR